jgi:hypothetical protein
MSTCTIRLLRVRLVLIVDNADNGALFLFVKASALVIKERNGNGLSTKA